MSNGRSSNSGCDSEALDTPDPIDLPPVQESRPGSVEYWASGKPDSVAIIDGDRIWTWSQFNDQANRLANALASKGLSMGDVVAVRTQIRAEWMIINAALGKLGCVLLGLNWRLTALELEFMLNNSGAAALICDDAEPAELLPALRAAEIETAISIDSDGEGFDRFDDLISGGSDEARYSVRDTPLIIYTSGTTGQPKGVVLGRLATDPPPGPEAIEFAASVLRSIPRTADDTVLISLPLSHGSAPAHIRRQVQVGGQTVLGRRFDPEDFLRLVQSHGITVWIAVPTMLNRLAALPEDVVRSFDLSSLNSILVGAAPVSPSIKEWVGRVLGRGLLHEGYGSSETGMVSHLSPAMYLEKPGSCGTAFKHVHISIRDGDGRELPAGERGEIWVKSPSTIKSYYKAPPLGIDTLDKAGFFRTGDIGYLDEDDYLFITGRSKDMIVSGGVNIYPAEIEAALHEHPAVQDVAVIGIPDPEFGEQVKAFVELNDGMALDPAELIEFGRRSLASYKLPRSVEVVAALPRNLTGKVMKNELRAGYWAGRETDII